MRDSIIFYLSHYEIVKQLDNEHFGMLYRALFEFALGNNPKIDKSIEIPFGFINNQVVLDKDKYKEKCLKNRENGKLGGRPKKNKSEEIEKPKKANGFFENPNDNENENENDNDNENGNDIYNSHPVPPVSFTDIFGYGLTLGAGKEYCRKFYKYYEDRGWLNNDGKPIHGDWKNVFNNWWEKDSGQVNGQVGGQGIVPSWLNKEIKEVQANPEEEQKIKDLLKEYE